MLQKNIVLEVLGAYFTAKGGALAVMQSILYAITYRDTYRKESNRNRERMITALKRNYKSQLAIIFIFVTYTFLDIVYSRLAPAYERVAALERDNRDLRRKIDDKNKNAPSVSDQKSKTIELGQDMLRLLIIEEKTCLNWNNRYCNSRTIANFNHHFSKRLIPAIEYLEVTGAATPFLMAKKCSTDENPALLVDCATDLIRLARSNK